MQAITDSLVRSALRQCVPFGDAFRRWASGRLLSSASPPSHVRRWLRAYHRSARALWVAPGTDVADHPLFIELATEILVPDADAPLSSEFLAVLNSTTEPSGGAAATTSGGSVRQLAIASPPSAPAREPPSAAAPADKNDNSDDDDSDTPAAKRRCLRLADVATAQWLADTTLSTYQRRACLTQHIWQMPHPPGVTTAAAGPDPVAFIDAVADVVDTLTCKGFGVRKLAGGGRLVYATTFTLQNNAVIGFIHTTVWQKVTISGQSRPSLYSSPSPASASTASVCIKYSQRSISHTKFSRSFRRAWTLTTRKTSRPGHRHRFRSSRRSHRRRVWVR
jgi:hypothetical protein